MCRRFGNRQIRPRSAQQIGLHTLFQECLKSVQRLTGLADLHSTAKDDGMLAMVHDL